ncbi:hypothetical protein AC249_AIPGENE4163 [Exaiptasia diaphana]|nr:hypothetical protein AC249_AIPGENE4163 [Exaiptasia diaphana]
MKDPPEEQPLDWRLKCQGLLPEGKSINSYSPWLGIAKVCASTWKLVDEVFSRHEQGRLKAMKTGKQLESHRLWRELLKLDKKDREYILSQICNCKLTIQEATQHAEEVFGTQKVQDVVAKELGMDREQLCERFGARVGSKVLVPFSRLKNVELLPAVLMEYINELRGERATKELCGTFFLLLFCSYICKFYF